MKAVLWLVAGGLMSNAMPDTTQLEARLTCKSVSSCEEAVMLWCNGYGRADGDSDGIPCETVCHSREQVDEIRAAIGC